LKHKFQGVLDITYISKPDPKVLAQKIFGKLITGLYYPEQINTMEIAINQCIFSYLATDKNGYLNPFEAKLLSYSIFIIETDVP
jgi:hypothetical protein